MWPHIYNIMYVLCMYDVYTPDIVPFGTLVIRVKMLLKISEP